MNTQNPRELGIDESFFMQEFGRDLGYLVNSPLRHQPYLNRETGELVWLVDKSDDPESAPKRGEEMVSEDQSVEVSDNLLKIPGLPHAEHLTILREFLESQWTDNNDLWVKANHAPHHSMDEWLLRIDYDTEILREFYRFKYAKLLRLAVTFLYRHGIQPDWQHEARSKE